MQDAPSSGLPVRTTLDIEDDGLAPAKELARRQGQPAGESTPAMFGFRSFAAQDGRVVSNEQIDQLRDVAGL